MQILQPFVGYCFQESFKARAKNMAKINCSHPFKHLKSTIGLTDKWTDRQRDQQRDRHDRQTDRKTDRHAGQKANRWIKDRVTSKTACDSNVPPCYETINRVLYFLHVLVALISVSQNGVPHGEYNKDKSDQK